MPTDLIDPTSPVALVLRIALGAMVLVILGAISYRDIKTREIPDALNLALLVLGVVSLLVQPEIGFNERLIGLAAVAAPLLILTLARPGSFGGGDVKLMAAAGFLLGWKGVLLAAALGLLAGGAYAIYLMVVKRVEKDEKFPFGPFLCFGIAVAYFFQAPLLAVLLP